MKNARFNITDKLLESNISNIKSPEMTRLLQNYDDAYKRLEDHPDKNNLLNNDFTDPALEKQREELLSELLYYQGFKDAYAKAYDPQSSKTFYNEIKDLNKNFFNIDLNIIPCIKEGSPQYELKEDHNNVLNDSLKYFKDNIPNNNFSNAKQTDPAKFQKNFYYEDEVGKKYDGDLRSNGISKPLYDDYNQNNSIEDIYNYNKDNPNPLLDSYVKNSKDEIHKWNEILQASNLNDSVGNYSNKRLNIEKSEKKIENPPVVNNYQKKDMTSNLYGLGTPVNDNRNNIHGAYQSPDYLNVPKFDNLSSVKPSNLAKKEEAVGYQQLSALRTPNERNSKLKARSRFENTLTRSDRMRTTDIQYSRRKYENSGTDFVNQLYENINRVLDRGHNKSSVRNISQAY